MTRIQRSAIVMHSSQCMYDLVNDVRCYPEFLNGCVAAEIVEHSDVHMLAKMHLKKAGIQITLVTRNTLSSPSKIVVFLEDGPFSSLCGEWVFTNLTDSACKVSFDLRFEFKNSALRMAAATLFSGVANDLVDAVCQRADSVYGGAIADS